ncbi:hypothetical protein SteCoe_2908 [Stentor coeruleus]|uniref:Uncharacterized protein n=1 Tax=Stentor coeruleus TaxID=5963 RepID=A0A1R2CYA8_9CILI|nr:hypothetical protein SteCoe_2908 [Stentor coeruleus]
MSLLNFDRLYKFILEMRKVPSYVNNILPLPSRNIDRFSSPELKKCSSARKIVNNIQINTPDPFDNMKCTGKNNPTLRPILNKHRKSPSLSNLLTKDNCTFDKPCSKSLNASKSHNFLPKIFQAPLPNKKCIIKPSLPPILYSERVNTGSRNVSTPFFKPQALMAADYQKDDNKQDRAFRKRKTKRSKFFDHIKQKKLSDVSFGDSTDVMNNVFSKTKLL